MFSIWRCHYVFFLITKSAGLINLTYPLFHRVYVKGTAVSSSQGKLELKLENVRDLSLTANTEASIQKDNVVIKAQADSAKLGLKNYQVEISSKDAGSGKRLEIHATNDNKNVFSGR